MFFIISQIFASITLCSVVIGFQIQKKSVMLFWITLANASMAFSYAFLGAWVGVALSIIATFRTISFMVLDKYRAKTPKWLDVSVLLAFLLVNCAATCLTWSMWFEWVVLSGALLGVYGFWSKGKHASRICTFMFSSILITYNILVGNWIAIAVEASVLTSIIIYYSRGLAQKNKKLPDTAVNVTISNGNENALLPH